MIWIEGLLLMYMVDLMLRHNRAEADGLSRVLLAGVVGASLFTVYRIVAIVTEQHGSVRATLASLSMTRIGIHSPDVNAVGSLYALFVVPAFWSALVRGRLWRWAAFASILCGLWGTGSRAAILAACGGVIVVASLTRTMSRRAISLTVSASAVVAVLLVLTSSANLNPAINALHIRLEMAKLAILVWAAHPAFGVGPHQVLPASRPLISERVLALFPEAAQGENAHNNFIQILAEFGLIGGVVVLSTILLPLYVDQHARQARNEERTPRVCGRTLCVFADMSAWTSLPDSPVPLALLPDAGLGVRTQPTRGGPSTSLGRARLLSRLRADRGVDALAHRRGARHARFRACNRGRHHADCRDAGWNCVYEDRPGLRPRCSSGGARCHCPLRLTPPSPPSCLVHVSANGRPLDILNPPRDHWLHARYLWQPSPGGVSGRLDLAVTQIGCRVMVGRMTVE